MQLHCSISIPPQESKIRKHQSKYEITLTKYIYTRCPSGLHTCQEVSSVLYSLCSCCLICPVLWHHCPHSFIYAVFLSLCLRLSWSTCETHCTYMALLTFKPQLLLHQIPAPGDKGWQENLTLSFLIWSNSPGNFRQRTKSSDITARLSLLLYVPAVCKPISHPMVQIHTLLAVTKMRN